MAYLYGLLNQADLKSQRVSEVGVDRVFTAIDRSVEEHDRQMRALLSLFATQTTKFKTRYETPIAFRLQPLDDAGRARPMKGAGSYDIALPIHSAGAAWGRDYKTSVKMTVAEAARITSAMQDADMRWLRDHLMAALFYKNGTSAWTFPDPLNGDLSVFGLANGDSVAYNIMAGADTGAADDHVKGVASLAASTFKDARDELREHPENGDGEVIAFIPTASVSTVEGLTGFYPASDPNLRSGSGVTELARTLNVTVPGELVGYIEKTWVYEWRSMPSNYMVAVPLGGEPALALREEPEAELQGFRRVADRNDHPWYETQYQRHAGFGAWNRVGAVVYRTNNATYAIPTGYESPMP